MSMEISEPNFLGKIRFGAKENCPCVPGGPDGGFSGEARVTCVKQHQCVNGWNHRIVVDEAVAWRSMTATGGLYKGLTAPGGFFVEDYRGTYTVDRTTGLCAQKFWILRDGQYLVESTSTYAKFFKPGQGEPDLSGAVSVHNPYTYEELSEDVEILMNSQEASVWLVPSDSGILVGRAETGPGGIKSGGGSIGSVIDYIPLDPWMNVNYIDYGPADGRILRVPDRSGTGVFFQGVGALGTYLRWGYSMSRSKCLVPVEGYFSTQVSTLWDYMRGGVKPADAIEPKKYWHVSPGRIEMQSPIITPAEAKLGPAIVSKVLTIRLGDMPPSDVQVVDWPRRAGFGTC